MIRGRIRCCLCRLQYRHAAAEKVNELVVVPGRSLAHMFFVAVLTVASSCTPGVDSSKDELPTWATGGTLQEATLNDWAAGTMADRMATAGGLIYETLWQGHLQSDDSIAIFKGKVEKMVQGLDGMAKDQASLSKFDPALSSRSIRFLITEMTQGDRELIGVLWGPTPVDE